MQPTPNQIRFAESLARQRGWFYSDLDDHCTATYGAPLRELTREQVSWLIDELLEEGGDID